MCGGGDVFRTIATSFLIESLSNFRITRTGIKSRMFDLDQFRLLAGALPALEGPHRFRKMLSGR